MRGEDKIDVKRPNIQRCRTLRRAQTDAEKKLWAALRNRQLLGVKFRRQVPIGKYMLDFYSPECQLGIEADGGQHYDSEIEQYDQQRTDELLSKGIRVLRFSNRDILKNIEGVCEVIGRAVKGAIQRAPSPLILSPDGGEETRVEQVLGIVPSPLQRGEG